MTVLREALLMKISDRLSKLLMDEETARDFRAEGSEPRGLRGLLQVLGRHFRRLTLSNPVAVLAGAAYLASTFYPWWRVTIIGGAFVGTGRTLDAFAFYYRHNIPPEGWRFLIEMPLIASVAAAGLLLVYFLIILWGATSAGKKGKLFVAGGGLLLLFYTAGFFGTVFFACYRIGGTPLKEFPLAATFPVVVVPVFLPAYFAAIGAGAVCLFSSLIHGKAALRLHRKKAADLAETT
jgi:hypothetical protein